MNSKNSTKNHWAKAMKKVAVSERWISRMAQSGAARNPKKASKFIDRQIGKLPSSISGSLPGKDPLKLPKDREAVQKRLAAFLGAEKGIEKKAGFGEDVTREGIELAKKLKSTGLHSKLRGNTMKDYMHHMDMSAHPKFMQGVKLKVASLVPAGLEAAGLGILARPAIKTLRNKKSTPEEKSHAKHDAVGLGVLAAHPTYELGKAVLGKLKKAGVGKALVKIAGDFDRANYIKDMARKPMAAPAQAAAKPQFTMEHLQKARASMGQAPSMVRPRPPMAAAARTAVPHMATGAARPMAAAAGAAGHNPGLLGKALSIFRKV